MRKPEIGALVLAVALVVVAGIWFEAELRDELVLTARWATVADAIDGGMLVRGWLPPQIPRDATNLVERRDLDTNHVFGVFSVDESQRLSRWRVPLEFARLLSTAGVILSDPRIEVLKGASDFAAACDAAYDSFAVVIDRRSGHGLFWNQAHCE